MVRRRRRLWRPRGAGGVQGRDSRDGSGPRERAPSCGPLLLLCSGGGPAAWGGSLGGSLGGGLGGGGWAARRPEAVRAVRCHLRPGPWQDGRSA